MKIAYFDTHPFEKQSFMKANQSFQHELIFFETRLNSETANLAQGCPCVCAFVNDKINAQTLEVLATQGTRLIALRSAGFNHVDLDAAELLNLKVVRVPEYSPYAVAEHAMALILSLNRKTHRAYNRVREGNFSLDGLVGFDLHNKTVGIIGTGKIGRVMAKILQGFGCQVIAFDRFENADLVKSGVKYVELDSVFRQSDIISLHIPLNPETHHIVDMRALGLTKAGVMIINTGRGALIDTHALIQQLKSGHIGYAGLDVYEEEEGVFFENLSDKILLDDQLARLLTFPNVLLTAHQAFLTQEALKCIAETTLQNISDFEHHLPIKNEVCTQIHYKKN
jgi:D-lactate dehydrogenase